MQGPKLRVFNYQQNSQTVGAVCPSLLKGIAYGILEQRLTQLGAVGKGVDFGLLQFLLRCLVQVQYPFPAQRQELARLFVLGHHRPAVAGPALNDYFKYVHCKPPFDSLATQAQVTFSRNAPVPELKN